MVRGNMGKICKRQKDFKKKRTKTRCVNKIKLKRK